MKKYLFLFVASLAFITQANAQSSRKYIREKIEEWGKCKNVALTLAGGDLAIYGKNGWAGNALPADMSAKLRELNREDKLIDDIVLTEAGSWLILWGDNGISSYNIPDDLYEKLKDWNDREEVITSVTFNDRGDWIAISKKHYAASSEKVIEYIKEGEEVHGELWAAHLTDDGMVLCYERGYKYLGNVPDNLKQRLKETDIDVYRIKFLKDGTYFFADMDGKYAFYM